MNLREEDIDASLGSDDFRDRIYDAWLDFLVHGEAGESPGCVIGKIGLNLKACGNCLNNTCDTVTIIVTYTNHGYT